MNLQPTLSNDTLLLRPLEQEDHASLYAVAKDPLIWEQHPCDRYKPLEFKKFFAESMESNGTLVALEQASGSLIGSSRYAPVNGVSAVEIGWSFLARSYWGGLYNASMKNLMINYAFQFVDRVLFHIDKTNIRSQKATQKIGATLLENPGELQKRDLLVFQVSKGDWVYRKPT